MIKNSIISVIKYLLQIFTLSITINKCGYVYKRTYNNSNRHRIEDGSKYCTNSVNTRC